MGDESETILKTFALTDVEQNDFDTVMSKFDTCFRPKVNYLEYRVLFQNRVQNYDEPIEQFIRALYEIAENCNYGENKHENIRDRIVIECQDKEVSQSLRLKGNELTLDDAITTARQYEQVKSQLSTKRMTDVDELTSQFKTMSRKSNTGYKGGQTYYRDAANEHKRDWQSRNHTQSCGRCDRSHKPEEICPARDRKCRKYDKIGHFQTVCRTKSVKEVISTESGHCKHNYFLGSVTKGQKGEPWCVTLPIGVSKRVVQGRFRRCCLNTRHRVIPVHGKSA